MVTINKYGLFAIIISGIAPCNTATGQSFAERMTIDPAKYEFYTCDDLRLSLSKLKTREQELKRLMDKASRGPGGDFINLIAYKTEFLQTRGYQNLALEKQKVKNCRTTSIQNRTPH
jgi:hypothetical protein